MAGLSIGHRFSDLRGVTVRNTFLEFEDEDGARDDIFHGSGFTRQASEPAKPFNRQVSEQTTTGSGATLEDSVAEPDDSYSQLSAYMGSPLQHDVRGRGQAHLGLSKSLQAPTRFGMPRFCPNCGAEADPNHRFCPYCCYQLQSFQPPPLQVSTLPTHNAPVGLDQVCAPQPGVPSLLVNLRRFRYIEACAADVELAHVLCVNHLQTAAAM